MALSSYADLVSSIQSWMFDRSDLATVCPDFIALTEAELNRELRTRDQMATTTLTLTDSVGTLPADYLMYRRVTALTTPRRVLDFVTADWLDWNQPYRSAGDPLYFSISGDAITILPITTAEIEFEYFTKIPALSTSNTTNWLLDKLPNIYLYGALKHACIFIGNEEQRAAMFGQMFNGLVEQIKRDEAQSVYAYGRMRNRGVTP